MDIDEKIIEELIQYREKLLEFRKLKVELKSMERGLKVNGPIYFSLEKSGIRVYCGKRISLSDLSEIEDKLNVVLWESIIKLREPTEYFFKWRPIIDE